MELDDVVKFFHDIGKGDVGMVGGKGASLGELSVAGMPVPPGFVVVADVSRKYASSGMPETIAQAILTAFDDLGAGRVAVRSSALVEDSADASWAGQFESFLNIDRGHVVTHDRRKRAGADPDAILVAERGGRIVGTISFTSEGFY